MGPAQRVCRLREVFLDEWRAQYPTVPPPVLRGLGQLCEADVIDESSAAGYVCAVTDTLCAVSDKIQQLRDQIERKVRFQKFLVRVISALDAERGCQVQAEFRVTPEDSCVALSSVCDFCGKGNLGENNTGCVKDGEEINPSVTNCSNDNVCHSAEINKVGSCISVKDDRVGGDSKSTQADIDIGQQFVCSVCCSTSFAATGANQAYSDICAETSEQPRPVASKYISCIDVNDFSKKGKRTSSKPSDPSLGQPARSKAEHEIVVSTEGDPGDLSGDESTYDNTTRRVGGLAGNSQGRGGDQDVPRARVSQDTDRDCHRTKGRRSSREMFRRKKSAPSGRAHTEDTAYDTGTFGHSRDNFLAVTSRRSAQPAVEAAMQENHANKSSPKMSRNFHMLKMTSGFDLVMDDGSARQAKDAGTNRGHAAPTPPASGDRDVVSKQKSDPDSDRPPKMILVPKNSAPPFSADSSGEGICKHSDDVTAPCSSSPPRVPGSQVNNMTVHANREVGSDRIDLEPSIKENSTEDLASFDSHKQQLEASESETASQKTSPEASEAEPSVVIPATTTTGPSSPPKLVPRTSLNRSVPPPPVARKPLKPGSGKKLPPIPQGVKPFSRQSNSDSTATATGSRPTSGVSEDDVKEDNISSKPSEIQASQNTGPNGHLEDRLSAGPPVENISEVLTQIGRVKAPTPPLRDYKTKCLRRQSSGSEPDSGVEGVRTSGSFVEYSDSDILSGLQETEDPTSGGGKSMTRLSTFYVPLNTDGDSTSSKATCAEVGQSRNAASPTPNTLDESTIGQVGRAQSPSCVASLVEGSSEVFLQTHTAVSHGSRSSSPNVGQNRDSNSAAISDENNHGFPQDSLPSSTEAGVAPETTVFSGKVELDSNASSPNGRDEITDSSLHNPSGSAGNEDDGRAEFSRMQSSASSDTVVDPQDRKESFSSDVDVKDAIYSLDSVLKTENSDTMRKHDGGTRSSGTKPQPKARTRPASSYDNWTINRALTTSITTHYSDDEDDEIDDGRSPSTSSTTSPNLQRQTPSKGSKDSGLCDDMVASQEGLPVLAASSGSENELINGRFRDLKSLHLMASCAEEEDMEDTASQDTDDTHLDRDLDNISVASDFVFTNNTDDDVDDDQSKEVQPQALPGVREEESSPGGGGGGTTPQARLRRAGGWAESRIDQESLTSMDGEEEEASLTMDSSYEEADSAREGMLKMRQLLVKGVLDSEKAYLDILALLINYKKVLEASRTTSRPVISEEEIRSIFFNIETLFDIHQQFVQALAPKVLHWTHGERIGEIFKILILNFDEFIAYLTHYQQAVSTIHKCAHESERFQELAEQIIVNSTIREVTSLEDALFKPVQRVQRNTLVLHDLLKYTPEDHPDHEQLQKALKLSQFNLEKSAEAVPQTPTTQVNRRLVKSSFLVELVNGVRKLRYMFLFSDCLICTKRETHRNNKVSFDIKWLTSLSLSSCDTRFAYNDDTKHTKREDIDVLKNKIRALKKDLRNEMRKYDDNTSKHRSIGLNIGGSARAVEKIRKKLHQNEALLILASPKLPFKVSINGGKVYTLLMTTDYEREEWKETISSLCKKCGSNVNQQQMDPIFGQELINSVKETPQVNKIGSVLLQKDEDMINGTLNVTIHTMNGLTYACDTYCCIEMDSFGHFFMKARTHICDASRDPSWNEDFELELEGSQTLRILCFKKGDSDSGDVLLGRGALELSTAWLKKGSFQEKTIAMNEISLVISVRHTPVEKTMSRTPSCMGSAVFGVQISSLARREGKTMPTIVTACVQEVEKRGLDEVGIYRVSGVTSDLQTIKRLFDRHIKLGASALADADIHAVTGVLKLYFRELPSPLFTEDSYQSFVDTLKLSDEEAKTQCMLSLLHSLPDTNYYTIVYLFEHMVKVARNVGENKMSVQNLATVFGPTLLAPATKETSNDLLFLMSKGAEQAMRQSSVVNYLLGLAVSGRSLRRSAQ